MTCKEKIRRICKTCISENNKVKFLRWTTEDSNAWRRSIVCCPKAVWKSHGPENSENKFPPPWCKSAEMMLHHKEVESMNIKPTTCLCDKIRKMMKRSLREKRLG